MRKRKKNLRNLVSTVSHIVNQLLVLKWDLLRKLHAGHTKIVISKFAFQFFFTIIIKC